MSQIFLFTGENRFAMREELLRWMTAFREKHGSENLVRIAAAGLTLRALLDDVGIAPFLAEKRLVTVDGIPPFSKEDVVRLSEVIHPQVILLFVEPKPDQRLSAVKELRKIAEVKEFRPLSRAALERWVQNFLAERRSAIEPPARDFLLELIGEDQEILALELEKLALSAPGRAIGRHDVSESVIPFGEQAGWRLLDLLADGRREEALRYAQSLFDRGETPHALWNRLLWFAQSLVEVRAALAEGQREPAAIARSSGVHIMTVQSLLPLARGINQALLREMVDAAVTADIGLKTGVYRATAEAPEELCALIDRFILSFPTPEVATVRATER